MEHALRPSGHYYSECHQLPVNSTALENCIGEIEESKMSVVIMEAGSSTECIIAPQYG